MLADLKFALRQLRKSPGFTIVAVLTLALGIGACTAVFSVVNTTILHPFPYSRPDRLVVIYETNLPKNPRTSVSFPDYRDYQRQSTAFEAIAAIRSFSHNYTRKGGDPFRSYTEHVTSNFFSLLGVPPVLGRVFRPEEDAPGRGNVAILGYHNWLSQFQGDPGVIGQTIVSDGQQPLTIVGVMPENFQAEATAPQIYVPLDLTDQVRLNRSARTVRLIGRLKDGVTIGQASRELDLIDNRLAQKFPDSNKGWGLGTVLLIDDTVAFARPLLYTLLGAVGFLLLIACVNIANLLLVRATSRQKEISIRLSLGASRLQIVRQLLCESLLLALLGGALGVLLAQATMKLMLTLAPANLPRIGDVSIDTRALVFTCIAVLLTGIGFGLAPAFQATRVNLNDVLKDSGRGTSHGAHGLQLRGLLVVSEVALALILLGGAGLLIRSFIQYQDLDPGFRRDGLFTAPIALDLKRYPDTQSTINFTTQAVDRISRIHGISGVAFNTGRFSASSGGSSGEPFKIAGRPEPPPNSPPLSLTTAITPDYVRTFGVPLLRGRTFTARDVVASPPVVIISKELARIYFPNSDPIGQRINLIGPPPPPGTTPQPPIWREIVGVIGNTWDVEYPLTPVIYLPFTQQPGNFLTLVLRTTPGVRPDLRAIAAAVHSLDKDLPFTALYEATSIADQGTPAARRFSMALSIAFSGVALLLAAIGIYGVMAFNVAQRTGEIGIRMALGAQPGDVLRMILTSGGRMIGAGLLIGFAGALAAGRLIASQLFSVSAYDPMTLGGVMAVLCAVGFLACWLPAHRATKVDPMIALRQE